MQTIYRPGQWHLLVIPGALVALPPDAPAEIVTALWERLPAQKTLATVLDVLTAHAGGSFTALPPFAAAVSEGDDVRIALRGGVSARVSTADGAQQLDGAAVTTWSERFVGGATRVEITVEESAGHAGLPVQTGIVRAAAVSAEFESIDASPLAGALGPTPIVEPSDPGVSAAVLTAAAVGLAGFGATAAAVGLGAAQAAGAASASAAGAASAAARIRSGSRIRHPSRTADPTRGHAASATGSAAVRDESDADDAISAPLVGSVAVPPAPEPPASEPSPDSPHTASGDADLDARQPDAASASDLDESASDADDADRAAPADDANGDAVSPPPARPVDPDAPTEQLDALPVVAELVAPDAPPVDDDAPHGTAAADQDRAAVVEGVTLIPTEATIGATDDDFDQLFGDTVHTAPPAPRISAPPAPPLPPAPFPVQGDHDGSTVSADELRALRQQPSSADETPTAVLTVAGAASASAVGRIRVSSGQVVALDRTVIIGRRPRSTRASGANLPHLIAVESPQQDISRSHLEVRPEGDTVVVIDLHTTNGSTLLRPGADPVRLHPGEQTLVLTGDVVDLGDGITIAFEDLP